MRTHPVGCDVEVMSEPTNYEIVIRGRANARVLRPLLDGFVCHHTAEGATRLTGLVHDPSHLHGIVAHLTSMNVELISITPAAGCDAVPRRTQLPSTTHPERTNR